LTELINGDCLEVLSFHDSNSVDALVTDPPAGIYFDIAEKRIKV
jgi:DNA modification methylase